jgi:hypothetical protein
MRALLGSNRELAKRLDQLEARLDKKLAAHDESIGPSPLSSPQSASS